MIRVCMFCDTVLGEKEPLHDKTPTHGICDHCFKEFGVKYENQKDSGPEVGQTLLNYANYSERLK